MIHGDRVGGIVIGKFHDLPALDIGRRHHELDLRLRYPREIDVAFQRSPDRAEVVEVRPERQPEIIEPRPVEGAVAEIGEEFLGRRRQEGGIKNRQVVPERLKLGYRIGAMTGDDRRGEGFDRDTRDARRPEPGFGCVDVFERSERVGTKRAAALERNRCLSVGLRHATLPSAPRGRGYDRSPSVIVHVLLARNFTTAMSPTKVVDPKSVNFGAFERASISASAIFVVSSRMDRDEWRRSILLIALLLLPAILVAQSRRDCEVPGSSWVPCLWGKSLSQK
jgi:hypothetical protein